MSQPQRESPPGEDSRSPKQSTLDRIRHAARQLFVTRGYHDARPQDIAREAGVANGTFYMHFADKQQAFLDFAEQAQNELLGFMEGRLAEAAGSRARWQATCGAVIDFDAQHPGLLAAAFLDPVFIAPRNEDAWRLYDRLGHLLSLTISGDNPPTEDDELISHGICGLLRQAMIYADRKKLDREEIVATLSRFIDQGLGTAAQTDRTEDLHG